MSEELQTMEEIWELENAIRAMRRHLHVLNSEYDDMSDEPEAGVTLALINAVTLSISLLVKELGYDLRS